MRLLYKEKEHATKGKEVKKHVRESEAVNHVIANLKP
jgi:hypothetical protein